MFKLVKNLFREKSAVEELNTLTDMHAGCTLGFGFMPQTSVSGKRFSVTEVNSYLFDSDSFLAYSLHNSYTTVHLIVANAKENAQAFLALSQRIHKRLFDSLFPSTSPEQWFACNEGEIIDLDPRTIGVPQGWLTKRYAVLMTTQGRLLDGDFRLRKADDLLQLSLPFQYVLLVDEDNTHALEAEKFEDGTLNVYATVYRPITDIGEVSHAPRKIVSDVALTTEKKAEPEIAATILAHLQKVESPLPDPIEPQHIADTSSTNILPIHGKFGRIALLEKKLESSLPEQALACETALAGKIIDEAQRNGMPISEIIRRVIDLPARINEEVFIPLALEDAEYAELARRYGISHSDHQGVREHILEDLRNFVGLKKKQ